MDLVDEGHRARAAQTHDDGCQRDVHGRHQTQRKRVQELVAVELTARVKTRVVCPKHPHTPLTIQVNSFKQLN